MTDFVASADIVKEPGIGESSTPYAITYAANGDTWTILSGVTVASTNNAAIFSDFSNNRLTNHGTVNSGNNIGVQFRNGNNGVVSNATDAWIVGLQTGVWLGGTAGTTSNTLDNDGSVVGLRFYGVLFAFGGGGVFNNRGDTYGDEAGVQTSSSAPVTINNDGSIRSANLGVYASQSANVVITVDNGAKGIIKAPTAIKSGGQGSVDLDNLGSIVGNIELTTAGADHVRNQGTITGSNAPIGASVTRSFRPSAAIPSRNRPSSGPEPNSASVNGRPRRSRRCARRTRSSTPDCGSSCPNQDRRSGSPRRRTSALACCSAPRTNIGVRIRLSRKRSARGFNRR